MFRKYFCFVFFALLFPAVVFGETLAIACFQNEDADEKCKNVTAAFEDFLFEPFFESGFIVTSLPLSEIKEQTEIKAEDLKNLFEELTGYILICRMSYGKDLVFNKKLDKKIPDWKTLKVSLINFSSGKEIYSKLFDMNKIKEAEPIKKGEELSVTIALEVIKAINKSKESN